MSDEARKLKAHLALQSARQRRAEMKARGESVEILDPLEKSRRNPHSLRAAVNAKCWDCVGADADPAPKWRIGNCQIFDCPLYAVRPYQQQHGRAMPVALRVVK